MTPSIPIAVRHNPQLARFYAGLLTAAKPKKLALTAAMRKLLTVLNGLPGTPRHGAHPNLLDLPRQSLTLSEQSPDPFLTLTAPTTFRRLHSTPEGRKLTSGDVASGQCLFLGGGLKRLPLERLERQNVPF